MFVKILDKILSYFFTLAKNLSNEETIIRLFEKGLEILTPGTKLTIQKIKKASDRLDLIYFLKDAT